MLLYLLHHPEIQRKVQAELDRVCGDSIPSLTHRSRSYKILFLINTPYLNFCIFSLPYTEAVLMEVLRLANITPFTIPHVAVKDTKLRGYNIPKVRFIRTGMTIFSFVNVICKHFKGKHCVNEYLHRPFGRNLLVWPRGISTRATPKCGWHISGENRPLSPVWGW